MSLPLTFPVLPSSSTIPTSIGNLQKEAQADHADQLQLVPVTMWHRQHLVTYLRRGATACSL